MRLVLKRTWPSSSAILGQLFLDDVFFCYTLERPAVCIPCGDYTIEMTYSPHFLRMMPLLDGVPERSAVRIHPGNIPADSDGCILVGYDKEEGYIEQSRAASDDLNYQISTVITSKGTVTISIQ